MRIQILGNYFFYFFLLFSGMLYGQQPAQYSMLQLNPYARNVGYAGFDNSLSITAAVRKQWVGLPGSPLTQNLNVHMPLYFLQGGIGINVENDALGAERNTNVSLSYNYILDLGNEAKVSLGVGGGLLQQSIDGTKLRAPEGQYEGGSINHNDNFLPEGTVSGMVPTFNAGMYLRWKALNFGLAAQHLTEPVLNYSANTVTEVKFARNYIAALDYTFAVTRKIDLNPGIQFQSDLIKLQPEVSIIFRYDDNIFGGVAFRGYNNTTSDALIFMAGMKVTSNLTLAYSYDLTVSGLSNYTSGSHEVLINYNLNKDIGKGRSPKIIFNPRYF